MKYVKKPVEIEAFQLGVDCAPSWFMNKIGEELKLEFNDSGDIRSVDIKTLEGTMTAYVGDFIIQGVKGELYPCRADIFYETYRAVE